jgi:hypothetical protein
MQQQRVSDASVAPATVSNHGPALVDEQSIRKLDTAVGRHISSGAARRKVRDPAADLRNVPSALQYLPDRPI